MSVILVQIGVLRLDFLSSILQTDGYESDDDAEIMRRRRRRKKERTVDKQMTPIQNIISNPDDPEEIQREIMRELNQHNSLFLTPNPI